MNVFGRNEKEEHFWQVFNKYAFQIYECSKTRKDKSLYLGEEFWNEVYLISNDGKRILNILGRIGKYRESDLYGQIIETPLNIIKIPYSSTATFLHPLNNIDIIDKK